MKKAIIILVIIFALLGVGIWEAVYVNSVMSRLHEKVTSIYAKFPDSEQSVLFLEEDVIELREYWNKKEPLLCLFFNHLELSDITEALVVLFTNIQLDDYNQSLIQIRVLYNITKNTSHTMGFNFQNIL